MEIENKNNASVENTQTVPDLDTSVSYPPTVTVDGKEISDYNKDDFRNRKGIFEPKLKEFGYAIPNKVEDENTFRPYALPDIVKAYPTKYRDFVDIDEILRSELICSYDNGKHAILAGNNGFNTIITPPYFKPESAKCSVTVVDKAVSGWIIDPVLSNVVGVNIYRHEKIFYAMREDVSIKSYTIQVMHTIRDKQTVVVQQNCNLLERQFLVYYNPILQVWKGVVENKTVYYKENLYTFVVHAYSIAYYQTSLKFTYKSMNNNDNPVFSTLSFFLDNGKYICSETNQSFAPSIVVPNILTTNLLKYLFDVAYYGYINVSSPDYVQVQTLTLSTSNSDYLYKGAMFTYQGDRVYPQFSSKDRLIFERRKRFIAEVADSTAFFNVIGSLFMMIFSPAKFVWIYQLLYTVFAAAFYKIFISVAIRFTKRPFRWVTDYLYFIVLIASVAVLHVTKRFWKPYVERHGKETEEIKNDVAPANPLLELLSGFLPKWKDTGKYLIVTASITTMFAATVKYFKIKMPDWYREEDVKYMCTMASSMANIFKCVNPPKFEHHGKSTDGDKVEIETVEDDEVSTFQYVKNLLGDYGVSLKTKAQDFKQRKFADWKSTTFGKSHKIILFVAVALIALVVFFYIVYYKNRDKVNKAYKDFINTLLSIKIGRISACNHAVAQIDGAERKKKYLDKNDIDIEEAKEMLVALNSVDPGYDLDELIYTYEKHGATWRERDRMKGGKGEKFTKPSKQIKSNNNNELSTEVSPTDIRQKDPTVYFKAMQRFLAKEPVKIDELSKYANIDLIFVDGNKISRQFIRGRKIDPENWSEKNWSNIQNEMESAFETGKRVYARVYDAANQRWSVKLQEVTPAGNTLATSNNNNKVEKHAISVDTVYKSIGRVIGGSIANFCVVDGFIYFNKHTLMKDSQAPFNQANVPAYIRLVSYNGDIVEINSSVLLYDLNNIDVVAIDSRFVVFCDFNGKTYTLPTLISQKNRNFVGHATYYYYDVPNSTYKRMLEDASVVDITPQRAINDVTVLVTLMMKGSSGCPLIDSMGKVIGIHVGKVGTRYVVQTLPSAQTWTDIMYSKKVEDYIRKKEQIYKIEKMENQSLSIYNLNIDHYPESLKSRLSEFDNFDDHEYAKRYLSTGCYKIGRIPQVKFRKRSSLVVDNELVYLCDSNEIDDGEYAITVGDLDVIYKDASKYAKPQTDAFDEALLIKAIKFVRNEYKFLYGTPFTSPEDVLKFKLRKQTSPGGLWTLESTTKEQVLKNHFPLLLKYLQDILAGKPVPPIIVSAAWKEELRLLEKILDGKVRTMVPVPIEVVAAFQMVFGHMMDLIAIHDFRRTKAAIGFSPYFGGWDDLENSFNGFEKYIETDISKFDSHVRNNIKLLMFNHFWSTFFVTPYEEDIAWHVYSSLFHVQFLFPDGNVVYFPQGGRWSGEPLTACENSIINYVLFVYACYKNGFDDEYIRNDTQCIFMGDDARIGFRKEANVSFDTWLSAIEEVGFPVGETEKRFLTRFEVSFCSLRTMETKFLGRYVFVPIDTKMLSSLRVCKSSATHVHKLQKLLSIYQYCYFTKDAPKMLGTILDMYHKYSNDPQIVQLMEACDPKYVSQYFLPQLSALQINESADKNYINKEMTFRYHGKYCGPGWNKGEWQVSQPGELDDPTPVDQVDALCQEHDNRYAEHESDLAHADHELARGAFEAGDYSLYGVMKIQGTLRDLGILSKYNSIELQNAKKELNMVKKTGNQKKIKLVEQKVKKILKKDKKIRNAIKKVPRMRPRKIMKGSSSNPKSPGVVSITNRRNVARAYNRNSITCPVTRVPITVTTPETDDPQGLIYSVVPVSPDIFYNTEIGQAALWYERYRIKKMWIEMDSNCLATNGGSAFILYDRDVTDERWDPDSVVDYSSIISSSRVDIVSYFNERQYKSKMNSGSGWKYTSIPANGNFEPNLRYDGAYVIGCVMPPSTSAKLAQFYLCVEMEFRDRVNEYEAPFGYYNSKTVFNGFIQNVAQKKFIPQGDAALFGKILTYPYLAEETTFRPSLTIFDQTKVGITPWALGDSSNIVSYGVDFQFYLPGDYYFSVNLNNVHGTAAVVGAGTDCEILQFNNSWNANGTGDWAGWVRKTSGPNQVALFSVSQAASDDFGSTGSISAFVMRTSVNQGEHGNFLTKKIVNSKPKKNVATFHKDGKNEVPDIEECHFNQRINGTRVRFTEIKPVIETKVSKVEFVKSSPPKADSEQKVDNQLKDILKLYFKYKEKIPTLTIEDFSLVVNALSDIADDSDEATSQDDDSKDPQ